MLLRDYELTFIVNPGLEDAALSAFSDRVKQVIKDKGGEVTRMESWGKKKLAYRIGNKKEGHYVFTELKAGGSTIRETERFLKLQEDVLRYLFVKKEETKEADSAEEKDKTSGKPQ